MDSLAMLVGYAALYALGFAAIVRLAVYSVQLARKARSALAQADDNSCRVSQVEREKEELAARVSKLEESRIVDNAATSKVWHDIGARIDKLEKDRRPLGTSPN